MNDIVLVGCVGEDEIRGEGRYIINVRMTTLIIIIMKMMLMMKEEKKRKGKMLNVWMEEILTFRRKESFCLEP